MIKSKLFKILISLISMILIITIISRFVISKKEKTKIIYMTEGNIKHYLTDKEIEGELNVEDIDIKYNNIYLKMDNVFSKIFGSYDCNIDIQTLTYYNYDFNINKIKNNIRIVDNEQSNKDNYIDVEIENINGCKYVPIYLIANIPNYVVKVDDKVVYDPDKYITGVDALSNKENHIISILHADKNKKNIEHNSYFGQNEGALWREEAYKRIEKYRKNNIKIIVKSIYGNYIKDFDMKVKMKDNSFHFTNSVTRNQLDMSIFNSIGSENFFKWKWIENRGKDEAKSLENYAKSNNLYLKGHCLWWDYLCSDELKKLVLKDEEDNTNVTMYDLYTKYKNGLISKEQAIEDTNQIIEKFEKIVLNHIEKEVKEFDYVKEWDVTNELLATRYFRYYLFDKNYLEDDKFINTTGGVTYDYKYIKNEVYNKFIANCFEIAKQSNPNVMLIYNENMVREDKENVIALINDIKKYTNKIDMLGVQSHIFNDYKDSPQSLNNKINYILEQTNVKYAQITEYSNYIESKKNNYTKAEKETKAKHLQDSIIAAYSNININGFNLWGYDTDNFCDEERQAYKELVYPWLNYTEEGTTGEDGYTTRLYKGTYTATVTLPNGKTKDIEFTVSDDTSDTVEVIINSKITDVKIKQQPSKLKYYRNDNIDLTDGILEISYDDGTAKEIQMNDSNINVSGFDSSSLGKQTIRLNYEGHEVHFDVNIEEKKETLIKNSIINIENCNKNIKENYNYIANNNNILSKYNDMISKLEELKNNINDIDNSKINNAYKSEYDLILEIIKEYCQNAISLKEEELKNVVNSIIESTNNYMELYKYYFDNDTINNDEIANSLNEIIDKYNENNDINVSFEEYYINQIKELYNNDITGNNNYANYLNKKRILNTIDIISYTLENKIKETAQKESQTIGITYNTNLNTLTNKDVIAQIKLPNSKSSIESNPNNEKYTFTENETKNITINIRGYKYNYNIKVTNIDKTPPQITGIEQDGKYKESVTPQITDENLSEVKLIKDGQEVENYKQNTAITQEGIYQLKATDKARNETSINFVIAYPEDEKYKIENNTIKNIKGETSVEKLKGKLQVDEKYTIKRKDTEIQNSDNIATGDILETESGNKYTLIVRGDLNKDGSVDIKDLVKMRRYLLLGNSLDESEVMAADTNLDGKEISIKDLVKMRIILLTQ